MANPSFHLVSAETAPARGDGRVVKLLGADVELGNFLPEVDQPGGTGRMASRALLAEIDGIAQSTWACAAASARGAVVRVVCGGDKNRWNRGSTSGNRAVWNEAEPHGESTRGDRAAHRRDAHDDDDDISRQHDADAGWGHDAQDWGRKYLASNGGGAYIDLHHLELCTPEVRSAHEYVAAWHAMLRIARQALEAANRRRGRRWRVQALVNNSDGLGNSYGAHLNILVSRRLWDDIFHYRAHYLALLASYQVSSIVLTGQGKVGSENGRPAVPYQISQRADFFETLRGVQTTTARPLVNSRDEALCGARRGARQAGGDGESPYARIHCIFHDANLCHVANLLKAGGMQMFLAMLEAGETPTALILEDPLEAVVRFSHDPTLRARCPTADGRELTAVEHQLAVLDYLRRFHQRGGFEGVVPRAGEILALYGDTLQRLAEGRLDELAGRLDWVLKLHIVRRALAKYPRLGWDSPEIKTLDHLYGDLDAAGLYWSHEAAGAVQRVVSPARIERFVHQPPDDTRAFGRAMLLRRSGAERIDRVDWDSVGFRLPGPDGWPVYRTIELSDPLGFGRLETAEAFESGLPLEEVLDRLAAIASREAPA